MNDSTKMKVCYSVSERGGKNYWTRIGVAFVNQDGSLNVKLECLPVNGELHIRDYVPQERTANGDERRAALREASPKPSGKPSNKPSQQSLGDDDDFPF